MEIYTDWNLEVHKGGCTHLVWESCSPRCTVASQYRQAHRFPSNIDIPVCRNNGLWLVEISHFIFCL